jgi:hypothetical protein
MPKLPVRIMTFSPEHLEFGLTPDQHGRLAVTVRLLGVEEPAGMTPGLGLALALYPSEARGVAQVLIRKADEAEARQPPS